MTTRRPVLRYPLFPPFLFVYGPHHLTNNFAFLFNVQPKKPKVKKSKSKKDFSGEESQEELEIERKRAKKAKKKEREEASGEPSDPEILSGGEQAEGQRLPPFSPLFIPGLTPFLPFFLPFFHFHRR